MTQFTILGKRIPENRIKKFLKEKVLDFLISVNKKKGIIIITKGLMSKLIPRKKPPKKVLLGL